jgi:thioredoxin-like negative regulator of GroEL
MLLTLLFSSFLSLLSALITPHALASSAPDFSLEHKAGAKTGTAVWVAKPPARHHINIQAPMSVESTVDHKEFKPVAKDPMAVQFQIPAASRGPLKFTLYLCDDQNTFCEKHVLEVGSDTKAQANVKVEEKPTASGETRLRNILQTAAAKNQPIVLDFSAIWCPPCNELEAEVFRTKEYQKHSQDVLSLRIDVDRPDDQSVRTKFHVTNYPTVVFLTPKGEEVSRFVGFRNLKQHLTALEDVRALKNTSLGEIQKQAKEGDRKSADRLGLIAFNQGNFKEAASWLKETKAEKATLKAAELKLKPISIKDLEEAADQFPDNPLALDWLQEGIDLATEKGQAPQKANLQKKFVARAAPFVEHPEKLDSATSTLPEILGSLGEIQDDLEDKIAAKKTYEKMISVLKSEKLNRGSSLELAWALKRLKRFDEAERLYTKMEKQFPEEFTFYFAHARLVNEIKDFNRAATLSEKAYRFSYGDNRIRAASLYATLLKVLGKKPQSLSVIDETLQAIPPPEKEAIGASKNYEKLRTLRKEVSAGA